MINTFPMRMGTEACFLLHGVMPAQEEHLIYKVLWWPVSDWKCLEPVLKLCRRACLRHPENAVSQWSPEGAVTAQTETWKMKWGRI